MSKVMVAKREPTLESIFAQLCPGAREPFQVSLSVAKFDRFEDLLLISKSLGAALTCCKLPHRPT